MMPRSRRIKKLLEKYDLTISALSCHGNPVHPNKETAAAYHQVFVDTCKLAQKLGVETVVTFSGCPGDSRNLPAAQLGHLCLAERLHRNPRLAVESGADPLLERGGRNRPVLRREKNRL